MSGEAIRGFYLHSKAWYADVVKDINISFGLYYSTKGCDGEIDMFWSKMDDILFPYLKCYCDGWKTLESFPDLIKELGEHDGEGITPDEFEKILLKLGFKDLTPYKDGNAIKRDICMWEMDPLGKTLDHKTQCGHWYDYSKDMAYCPHCGKKILIRKKNEQ